MYKIVSCLLFFIVSSKCDGVTDCESIECLEKQMIRYIDDMDQGGDIGENLSFKKISGSVKATADSHDEDIFERGARFLTEHEISLKISPSQARSIESEGRSKRLRKIILPILLLLKLKAAIIIPIILSFISLVAFKGLGVGITALAIAGATGLKSILDNHGPSKISYEVLPQVVTSQWSRSSMEGPTIGSPLNAGYHTIA